MARVIRKLTKRQGDAAAVDISDNQKDRQLEFLEYPPCEICEGVNSNEVLIATDGNRVVECKSCGLWYTSPRIVEESWIAWLGAPNERNKTVTDNRLTYGVALSRNIPLSFSFWWRIERYQNQKKLKALIQEHGRTAKAIFDVGCGTGFVLKSARDLGIYTSGNDLNSYAIDRMKESLGLDVYLGQLPDLVSSDKIRKNEYDILHMNDFIEHSYHPKQDLEDAHQILKNNGTLYVRTFCTDSDRFRTLGDKWDMLMWNHCYHFSSESLSKLIVLSGFSISSCTIQQFTGVVEIISRKK